jgi:hypothetical protein
MLVTREVITEDQYHDVRLSYALGAGEQAAVDAKLGAPAPRGGAANTVVVDEAAPLDAAAFLRGEGEDPDDPIVGTAPEPVQEVDTSRDVQESPAPAYPTAAEDDEDLFDPTVARKVDDPVAHTIPSHQKLPEANVIDMNEAGEERTPYKVQTGAHEAMTGIGEAPSVSGDTTGHIETPAEAMDGIGEAPGAGNKGKKRRNNR